MTVPVRLQQPAGLGLQPLAHNLTRCRNTFGDSKDLSSRRVRSQRCLRMDATANHSTQTRNHDRQPDVWASAGPPKIQFTAQMTCLVPVLCLTQLFQICCNRASHACARAAGLRLQNLLSGIGCAPYVVSVRCPVMRIIGRHGAPPNLPYRHPNTSSMFSTNCSLLTQRT